MGTNESGGWRDTWGLVREKKFIDGLGTHSRPWLNHFGREREIDPEVRCRLLKLYIGVQKDSPEPWRQAAAEYARELLENPSAIPVVALGIPEATPPPPSPATVNPEPSTPVLCACGCKRPAPLAARTRKDRGWVKGQPLRYITHHNLHPHKDREKK